MKELNKTIQDLKLEIESIKKSQSETSLKRKNLGKNSGVIDASIHNRIQEIEELMDVEDSIENIDSAVKENANLKGPVNIFNKFTDANFPNLKNEMPMNIHKAYSTPKRMDQNRNFFCHIIIKTPNALNKEY